MIITFVLLAVLISILLMLHRRWTNATGLFVNQFIESKSFKSETDSTLVIPLLSEIIDSLISFPKFIHFVMSSSLSSASFSQIGFSSHSASALSLLLKT